MTTPPVDLPPLTTDEEVLARVRMLVGGPARSGSGSCSSTATAASPPPSCRSPGCPRVPTTAASTGVARILGGLRGELPTSRGPGAVILTWERTGSHAVLPADREWAEELVAVCRDGRDGDARGLPRTPGGVQRLG